MRLAIIVSMLLHLMFLLQFDAHEEFGESTQSQHFRLRLEAELPRQQSAVPSTPEPVATLTPREGLDADSPPLQQNDLRAEETQTLPEETSKSGTESTPTLRYIEQLLRQIEQRKYYPEMARRRGLEDTITVRFSLQRVDKVSQLQVTGNSAMLENVSRNVVLSALPFPAPPEGVLLPLTISFQMRFSLN